jgi:hypothetical protein
MTELYVVTVGTTRRLVTAASPAEATEAVLAELELPVLDNGERYRGRWEKRHALAVGDVVVRRARDAELAEFERRRRHGRLELDADAPRLFDPTRYG